MPHRDPDAAPGVRLQRVMADAGVASRRECEEMIEKGLVEVNGRTVTRLPVFVDPRRDRISVDGRPIGTRPAARGRQSDGHVYIMLHKPDRVLTTTRDDDAQGGGGRTTVMDLVRQPPGVRLFPVGRLDYHTTGLVLLTNDGALADRLTHARYGVTRTYRVTVKGQVRPDMLDDLRRRLGAAGPESDQSRGVRIARAADGGGPSPESAANSVLEITLREGKSRQLAAVLEQMGIVVRKMIRTGIGPLRLRGVAVGESRRLTRDEVEALKTLTSPAEAASSATGAARVRARRERSGPGGSRPRRGAEPRAGGGNRQRRPGRGGRPR